MHSEKREIKTVCDESLTKKAKKKKKKRGTGLENIEVHVESPQRLTVSSMPICPHTREAKLIQKCHSEEDNFESSARSCHQTFSHPSRRTTKPVTDAGRQGTPRTAEWQPPSLVAPRQAQMHTHTPQTLHRTQRCHHRCTHHLQARQWRRQPCCRQNLADIGSKATRASTAEAWVLCHFRRWSLVDLWVAWRDSELTFQCRN